MTKKDQESKLAFITLCDTLGQGISSLSDTTLTVDGVTKPKAEFVQPLKDYVTAEAEVTATDAAYHTAVQKAHATKVPAQQTVAALKPYLKVRFGKANPALQSQFGVTPAKEPQTTVAVKAAAAEKAKATKAAKKAPKPPAAKPTQG